MHDLRSHKWKRFWSDWAEWWWWVVTGVGHERDNHPTARCRMCGVEYGCMRVYTWRHLPRFASRCGPDWLSTPECFNKKNLKILLKWNFFTNEDVFIWKTQVRPSSSGNRISFLGSSTDSHQITTTVKTLQRLIYKHTADSENAQWNRGKKGGKI
jgi:hypothetical protein